MISEKAENFVLFSKFSAFSDLEKFVIIIKNKVKEGLEIMHFRPCIDIHNGKVKQIVGGSLKDEQDQAKENFVTDQNAEEFAEFYKKDGLRGGHIILLNSVSSPYYAATQKQALQALRAWKGGMQIGGGINDENAEFYLDAGASHVIVTSFVFQNGRIHYENLEKLKQRTGKERLVLDLSCRKKDGNYYIVTDRWQKFTQVALSTEVLNELAGFCAEFLIHAVDVEGKTQGIERELVKMLGEWGRIPVTYAGGVATFEDLEKLKREGRDKIDVTIGSALDLFGGTMSYREVLKLCEKY